MNSKGDDGVDWNFHWNEVQKDTVDADISDFEWFRDLIEKIDLQEFQQYRVLELGCGYGRYCDGWTKLKGRYYGIDSSEVAIARARKHNPYNIFVLGNNTEMDVIGVNFEIIFTNTHLQHVANTNKAEIFRKAHNQLFKDGYLILNNEKDDVDTTTTMTYDNFKNFVEQFGFQLIRYAGINKGYVFQKVTKQ